MLARGEIELAGNQIDYDAGFGSPELSALTSALGRLVAVSDGLAAAVTRHDRLALTRSNEQADGLVDEVNRLTAALTAEDRAMLGPSGVTDLCEQLAAGMRRNAYLIEHAWATDAALMRLLMGLGTAATDGPAGGYGTSPGPTYVDREA
jgi:hypothetical protein